MGSKNLTLTTNLIRGLSFALSFWEIISHNVMRDKTFYLPKDLGQPDSNSMIESGSLSHANNVMQGWGFGSPSLTSWGTGGGGWPQRQPTRFKRLSPRKRLWTSRLGELPELAIFHVLSHINSRRVISSWLHRRGQLEALHLVPSWILPWPSLDWCSFPWLMLIYIL